MARRIETLTIEGPAGPLEARLEEPEDDGVPGRAAVICHPHPLYGGTMHNKVVHRLARAARRAGFAALRFNFRGAGASGGEHDHGLGEQDDLRAALGFLRERYPEAGLAAAGFSFGSRVGLRVCCQDRAIERFVAAGAPVDHGSWDFLASCRTPKFFVHSTHDQFGARQTMEKAFAAAAEPKHITWIEAEDHFFAGALDEFEESAFSAFSAGL